MINELDRIVLLRNLPEHDLQEGDIGTVVLLHQDGKGYEVEFTTLDGETLAVVTIEASDIRPADHNEIAHARLMAS